jgi:hypothetical protein
MCGSRRRNRFGGCSRRNGSAFAGDRGGPRYSPVGTLIRHMAEKLDVKHGLQHQPYGYGYEPEKQGYTYSDMRTNQQQYGKENIYGQGQRGVPGQWADEKKGQRVQSVEEKEAADLAEAIRLGLREMENPGELPSYRQVMKQ